MSITADLVKELRQRTGAGMMDCKVALTTTGGNIDAAVEELRKKGLAVASKKSGRVVAEGLIGVAVEGRCGALVEVNAETDFVARNDIFQNFVVEVSQIALKVEQKDILGSQMKNGKTVRENLIHNVATVGENQSFRRSTHLRVQQGVIGSYIHGALQEGLGTIGVLVALEVVDDASKVEANLQTLQALGRQLAMHIASVNPQFVRDVPPAVIESEREILTQQALKEGKPANIVEKMIEGRLRKFKQEIVFEEQVFVVDGETKILDVVQNVANAIGVEIKIADFIRYELGEGIDKKEENFAEEVAKTIG